MNTIKNFCRKHQPDIIISVVSGLILAILGSILKITNPFHVTIFLMTINILLLVMFVSRNKKNIKSWLVNTDPSRYDYSGDLYRHNQYAEREKHFQEEKNLLAECFVKKVLPEIIKKIKEQSCFRHLNIILDSGTTITPIFKNLMKYGVPDLDKEEFTIYTNNLAGISEIRQFHPELNAQLQERDFNLIGGKPLSKYRATTGGTAFEQVIWPSQNDEIFTLSVITSNWFLIGEDYKDISICARGEGHLDFKQSVIRNSNFIILVSPLGKILPLNDSKVLREMLPPTTDGSNYEDFRLSEEFKEKAILLTSHRTEKLSPLQPVSNRLKDLKDPKRKETPRNYSFYSNWPRYNPTGDRPKLLAIELPHEDIRQRKNFKQIYRFERDNSL